jgi:hypothetical protein
LKYYLSGAITSQPDFKKYFSKYEEELKYLGISDIFNPAATEWPKNVKWETCLKYDLKILVDCDCIILLPNWRLSRGAQLEIHVAKKLGIRIVEFNDFIRELTTNAS